MLYVYVHQSMKNQKFHVGSTRRLKLRFILQEKILEILFNRVNPLRAGIVSRPEDYRWNSLGYHVQTNNRDNFLSTDFGLKEFNVKSRKERIRRYRRYVYEAGAINRPDKMQAKVIDDKVVANERKNEFEISRISRFRYRTRYFTDSGIIGSKEFVFTNYQRFKHLFYSKHEKKPKPIKGLDGIYSLKRLSEMI